MKKKSISFIMLGLIIACGQIFAQSSNSSQKLGVTDADVKAVAANFEKIEKDFENYNIDPTVENLATYEKVAKDVENILKKYGISGPNRLQKTVTIITGAAYEKTATEVENSLDAATLAYMKSMGIDPYASIQQLKQGIHPDDMKAISRNAKLFDKFFAD